MGYINMQVAPVTTGFIQNPAWEQKETLLSVKNGSWIIIPDQIKTVQVTVSFTNNATGKVQTTTDLVDTIKNGSPVAVDWDHGTVNITTQDWCRPPTAIRAVCEDIGNNGSMLITVRAE